MKFEGHTDRVEAAIFTKGESKVLSTSNDKTIRLWNSELG
eukprot:gene27023-biopygen17590